jgi:hypothetical protein
MIVSMSSLSHVNYLMWHVLGMVRLDTMYQVVSEQRQSLKGLIAEGI